MKWFTAYYENPRSGCLDWIRFQAENTRKAWMVARSLLVKQGLAWAPITCVDEAR